MELLEALAAICPISRVHMDLRRHLSSVGTFSLFEEVDFRDFFFVCVD